MNAGIAIVTPRPAFASQLTERLQWGPFRTTWSPWGNGALQAASDCDLLVLDACIGPNDSLEFIQRVRKDSDAIILLAGERDDVEWAVAALRAGADGLIAPSTPVDELLARISAHLRRPTLRRRGSITIDTLDIDILARRCTLGNEEALQLTRVEFDLLAALAERAGAIVPRQWLAVTVLKDRTRSAERNLDTHLSHLRRKLGPAAHLIQTVRGVGYRLAPSNDAPARDVDTCQS